MAVLKMKNLRLSTVIGILEHEKKDKQDIILNIKIKFNDKQAILTDQIEDTIDYDLLEKKIINHIESNHYNLLEKLVSSILDIIMLDERVIKASVEIDKPQVLRLTEKVSIKSSRKRKK